MDWLAEPSAWIALITLTVLEIVLGIDNIIFISILSSRLPEEQQAKARQLGLALALITRIGLLLSLGWVMSLTGNLFRLDGLLAPLGIQIEPVAAAEAAGHAAAGHGAGGGG